ncbi:MAG: hypothetical protein HY343_06415, partial [Lentisphaerae bacterium]|nr:hypothetical protein [Lentisphaerota bacterium]
PVSRSIFVYILHSATLGRYYVGISRHLRGHAFWTSRATDWREVCRQTVGSLGEARRLEKAIKARGAKRYLEGQLPNPAKAGQD